MLVQIIYGLKDLPLALMIQKVLGEGEGEDRLVCPLFEPLVRRLVTSPSGS